MKKCDLENGMLVETTGGRFGVVVLKDSTDENCIKFLYDPRLLLEHGCIYGYEGASAIVRLADFDDDLNCCWEATEDDVRTWDDMKFGDKLVAWQIIRVYKPTIVCERNNLHPTPGGLMGDDIL